MHFCSFQLVFFQIQIAGPGSNTGRGGGHCDASVDAGRRSERQRRRVRSGIPSAAMGPATRWSQEIGVHVQQGCVLVM